MDRDALAAACVACPGTCYRCCLEDGWEPVPSQEETALAERAAATVPLVRPLDEAIRAAARDRQAAARAAAAERAHHARLARGEGQGALW